MDGRKSNILFWYIFVNIIILILFYGHALFTKRHAVASLKNKGEMVRRLQLTDLCLFTEARYTRHLSQADLNTPFQDHPFSLEHFPSGSLVTVPHTVKKINKPPND